MVTIGGRTSAVFRAPQNFPSGNVNILGGDFLTTYGVERIENFRGRRAGLFFPAPDRGDPVFQF